MTVKDKLITLEELDTATNPSNYVACPTPYNGNERIPMILQDNRYSTTVNELLSAAGGGGTSQGALVNYVKNCGIISSLPQTINDENITSDMVVLEAVLGTPSAQTGDWSVSTANGSVTISGSITGSTTLMLYFGVGMTTAPSLMTNLASTSADNILKAAPRPGVMGILGLANGGTGQNASSIADLRSKLGITPANIGALAKEINRDTFSDLNDTSLVGHAVLSKTGWSNMPNGATTWYDVYLFGLIQMAIEYSDNGALWMRTSTSGNWTSWRKADGSR